MDGKFYLTTAIDYVNDKPHLGHALEKIQADAIARYHRLKGEKTLFLTGTDEHGAKIVRAAESSGRTPQELADENAEKFQALRKTLNLSWDDFIRTSDRVRHWPGVRSLWRKIASAGDIYRKKYRGLYCVGHEAFITQKDLVGGRCRDHNSSPEVVEEENWFFKLSKYGEAIGSKIEKQELKIIPSARQNEILSLIRSGLEDVSFSRPAKNLSWGIPVPGDPEQTIYVWCDALANYITAIGYNEENSKFLEWWPADLHVIGKDILRFHSAIWPGMLISAGLPLPHSVFVHGFITVDGQKMSKTIGNVVDPVELAAQYGTDALRYYLLREIPSGEDGDFSPKKMEERYNGDLANGLGNLVARVAALGEKISPIQFDFGRDLPLSIRETLDGAFKNYENYLRDIRLHEALAEIWRLIGFCDGYLNDEKPWAIGDQVRFRNVVAGASYLVSAIANFLLPFLPETADKIKRQIAFSHSVIEIKKVGVLFPRLE